MAFVRPAAALLMLVACSSQPSDKVATGASSAPKCKADTKDTSDTKKDDDASLALAGTDVYYDPQVKVLINTYCASCHVTQAPKLLSYDQVAAAAADSMAAIDGGTMPKAQPLSATDKTTFRQWIAGGKKNFQEVAVTPQSPASTTPADDDEDDASAAPAKTAPAPTYLGDVKKILDKYCVSCHAKATRPPALDSLKAARDGLDASLKTIVGTTMPPGDGKVSGPELAKLKAWKAGGFQEGKAATKDEDSGASDAGCD